MAFQMGMSCFFPFQVVKALQESYPEEKVARFFWKVQNLVADLCGTAALARHYCRGSGNQKADGKG